MNNFEHWMEDVKFDLGYFHGAPANLADEFEASLFRMFCSETSSVKAAKEISHFV